MVVEARALEDCSATQGRPQPQPRPRSLFHGAAGVRRRPRQHAGKPGRRLSRRAWPMSAGTTVERSPWWSERSGAGRGDGTTHHDRKRIIASAADPVARSNRNPQPGQDGAAVDLLIFAQVEALTGRLEDSYRPCGWIDIPDEADTRPTKYSRSLRSISRHLVRVQDLHGKVGGDLRESRRRGLAPREPIPTR